MMVADHTLIVVVVDMHHSHPDHSPVPVGYNQRKVVDCNYKQSHQLEVQDHQDSAVAESVDYSNHIQHEQSAV
jgi:hypothetical protein